MTHCRLRSTHPRRPLQLFWVSFFILAVASSPAHAGDRPRVRVAVRELETAPYSVSLPGKVGVLEAAASLEVSFEVSGRVERILGQGAAVTKGDEIAALDSQLEKADLRRAELLLADARAELKRLRGLQASRAASKSALESAHTAVGLRRAELDAASERLARRRLTARFDGVMADVRLDPGEVTVPGSPVADLLNLDLMLLEVGIPARQIARAQPGAPVTVEIPALGPEPFAGTVHHVAPAATGGGTLFEVDVLVPNAERRLRPGMGARAFVITNELPEALVVPLAASVQRGGRRVVFFVDEGLAHAVPVDDAILQGDELVLSPAIPYRTLVVRGQYDLDDGMAVRVDNSILAGQANSDMDPVAAEVVTR